MAERVWMESLRPLPFTCSTNQCAVLRLYYGADDEDSGRETHTHSYTTEHSFSGRFSLFVSSLLAASYTHTLRTFSSKSAARRCTSKMYASHACNTRANAHTFVYGIAVQHSQQQLPVYSCRTATSRTALTHAHRSAVSLPHLSEWSQFLIVHSRRACRCVSSLEWSRNTCVLVYVRLCMDERL